LEVVALQDYAAEAADLLLEVVPLSMKNLAAELRKSKGQLDPAHFRLLALLHHEQLSLGELANQAAVSSATMSRTVTTLEERGWLHRDHSPQDGRVVLVCLTEEGRSVLRSITVMARQWILDQLEELSTEQQKALVDGLQVLQHLAVRPEGSN
jgi:DNA-binding MarR family transcriptional regulator